MARRTPLALVAIALGTLVPSVAPASAQSAGAYSAAAASDFGVIARPAGLRRVFRSCTIERYVTDDGEFVVRRICF